ncbi:MAG: Thioredoxin reductase [Candidatus Woesebacteria bacterium]|nr:MAG: Thioredoxin reductase [Candidatus Woesebacteria bacterium]
MEAQENLWDIVIIGSGPAGLTAAIYTSRGAASTLVLAGSTWGGQLMLTTEVENFPGFPEGVMGPDLMLKMRQQAERFGSVVKEEDAREVVTSENGFLVKTDNSSYKARSLIVASGAATKWLDAPGVKELIGRGVSSCAPCDAYFFKDKKVAVVGGGDSAMEEALVLSKFANEVIIVHRRDEFRASKIMQDKVFANPKIKVLWNTEVKEAKGKEKLEALVLINNKTQEVKEESFDGLFVAIGHVPQSEVFKGLLELDEKGYVKVFDKTKTNVTGIFVAGDVHDFRYRQAVTAAGFGCMAALDALSYIENLKSTS